MNQKPDGGPAFPRQVPKCEVSPDRALEMVQEYAGMSLRDWFAGTVDVGNLGSVRNGLFADTLIGKAPDYEEEPEAYLAWFVRFEAKIRYAKADAMLAERDRT